MFQETDSKDATQGQGYIVFMDGHDSARMKLPDEQLSAAEFVARKCFGIVVGVLSEANSVVSIQEPIPGQ